MPGTEPSPRLLAADWLLLAVDLVATLAGGGAGGGRANRCRFDYLLLAGLAIGFAAWAWNADATWFRALLGLAAAGFTFAVVQAVALRGWPKRWL